MKSLSLLVMVNILVEDNLQELIEGKKEVKEEVFPCNENLLQEKVTIVEEDNHIGEDVSIKEDVFIEYCNQKVENEVKSQKRIKCSKFKDFFKASLYFSLSF